MDNMVRKVRTTTDRWRTQRFKLLVGTSSGTLCGEFLACSLFSMPLGDKPAARLAIAETTGTTV